ncbi:MAG: CBS domain-containing protein, partial [Chthoniobacterales bacterium]
MPPRHLQTPMASVKNRPMPTEVAGRCTSLGAREAASELIALSPEHCREVLRLLLPSIAQDILGHLPPEKVRAILQATPRDIAKTWQLESRYPEDSVGSLMEPPFGVFRPDDTVGATIERLREITKEHLITYCFVTDAAGKLLGVVTMR